MEFTQQILKRAPARFLGFEYYQIIIDKIIENRTSNPDIAIECCKSLIEGLSKSIIQHTQHDFSERRRGTDDVSVIFKGAMKALGDNGAEIEEEFTRAAGEVVNKLGFIRSKRGDISHGKAAPKKIFSSARFSNFVVHLTDGLVTFMLEELFSLDFSRFDSVEYDANPDFNSSLDETYSISGGLSFSRALFDQDPVAYKEQLKIFIEEELEREEEMRESAKGDYFAEMRPEPSPDEDTPDFEE